MSMLRLAQLDIQTKILSKKEGTMCTVFQVRTSHVTGFLGQFAMTAKTANSFPAHDVQTTSSLGSIFDILPVFKR